MLLGLKRVCSSRSLPSRFFGVFFTGDKLIDRTGLALNYEAVASRPFFSVWLLSLRPGDIISKLSRRPRRSLVPFEGVCVKLAFLVCRSSILLAYISMSRRSSESAWIDCSLTLNWCADRSSSCMLTGLSGLRSSRTTVSSRAAAYFSSSVCARWSLQMWRLDTGSPSSLCWEAIRSCTLSSFFALIILPFFLKYFANISSSERSVMSLTLSSGRGFSAFFFDFFFGSYLKGSSSSSRLCSSFMCFKNFLIFAMGSASASSYFLQRGQ